MMRALCAQLAFLVAVAHGEFVQGGTLKVGWTDCGDSSTHVKVSGLSPDTLALGQKTTVTGTGTLDEAITGGTFDMNVKFSILSKTYSGDICQPKTFDLPLGAGTLTWDGLACPVAAGAATVKVDVLISASIPSSLADATIQLTSSATSGDKLICLTLTTAPASMNSSEEATCTGSGDPTGAGVCYQGAAGIGPLKETVKVDLDKFASEAGTLKLTGTGITGFTCGDHAFTKSGQDIKADLSDCLPAGVTLDSVKYCSDDDSVVVVVKDKAVPIPISAKLSKVACGADVVVV